MSSLDMREVTPGSAIDEFHFSMWAGFVEFALKNEKLRSEFEAETGKTFAKSPSNGLEIMIDQACGFDREGAQLAYIAEFARWVTPLYFGGPEDICPAIAAKLAQGIETRSGETVKQGSTRRAKARSRSDAPTPKSGDQ